MSWDYQQAVTEIESFGVMPDRPPSLEPMREALARAGLIARIDAAKVIVVAGTNGKGSVSAMLAALLDSAGLRTGLYTSPHLVETTERFRVEGKDLSPNDFARAYHAVRPIALDLRLSHFETLTLMAAWVFFGGALAPVDYAIFEVGLGGTWDATNAIPHAHCVITSLGLDHQDLLGSTLAEIARNKFGIVTRGSTVVHAPLPTEALEAARETRAATASRWIEAPAWLLKPPAPGARLLPGETPRFRAFSPWGECELSLAGTRGAANAAIAVAAFESLGLAGVPVQAHLGALARVRWPGRMERVTVPGAPCPIYLSGDHNPQGIASLLELLPAYPRETVHWLVGVGQAKDLDGIIGPLTRQTNSVLHLTETPFRGRPLDSYGPWLSTARTTHSDPFQALTQVFETAQPNDMIVVSGSLYLVGAIRALSTQNG